MKLRLFATAAVAAAAFAAPAFAQPVGSLGLSAAHTEAEAFGFEAEGESYAVDGSFALKASEAWTVTLGGAVAGSEGDLGDDTTFGVNGALTYAGSDWRVGPTVSYTDVADTSMWSVGATAQKYLGDVTLAGNVAYSNIDDADADIWGVSGEVRYFVSDNFRINGSLGWTTIDAGGVDVDGWNVGVGGEYQFAGTPWSITGGYDHITLDDVDVDADTFKIGVRYSFGGDLKARDRSGADLGSNSANSIVSLF